MNDEPTARDVLDRSLGFFADYLEKVNQYLPATGQYNYPSIFPTIKSQDIRALANKMDTGAIGQDIWKYLKNDFGNVGPNKGHIEFKSLVWLIQNNPNYMTGSGPNKKIKPVPIFTYPADKPDTSTYKMTNWGWGLDILLNLEGFMLDYDFIKYSDYYEFKFNNLKISLAFKSVEPTSKVMKTIWTTPAQSMTVVIKIPKNLAAALTLPDITFDIFGFVISLNPNFNWGNFDFAPLHFNFPEWFSWPFGPISIGDFLKLDMDCKWTIGLLLPEGPRFNLSVVWAKIKIHLNLMLNFLGFDGSSNWPDIPITYFNEVKKKDGSPEWAAIYFDISFVTNAMGFKPAKLFFLLGVDKSGHVKGGFLTCTGNISFLQNKSFMLRTSLQYDFELKKDEDENTTIEAYPGFQLEILSDQSLANSASCPTPSPASVTFGSFTAELDRLGMTWDKDEEDYVISADGAFKIEKLLRSKDPSNASGVLKLPFKGLGFTGSGKFVLKKSWITLKEAQQVGLDGIDAVQLFLRAYGYEKDSGGDFWIGFSGDLKLPVLNVTAGVDNLLFWSNGDVDLSGINIDTEIAKVLHLTGAVKWGKALMPPHLEASSDGVNGFGGLLKLGISAGNLQLGLMLGFTYVKIDLSSGGDIIAWSFSGEVVLPTAIELGCGFGIKSLGLMVGQNYLPLPKMNKLPYERWLEGGLNNDAENILDVVNYWTPAAEAFAAGFSIGLATTMDGGFILRAKAMLVLAIPGPLIVIAGKADVLRKPEAKLVGIFNLLIIYDHDDPGILASLSFRYDVKYLVSIYGMAELFFDFDEPNRWHFYLGTPDKPVSAKALGIFEAGAYLTIDAYKLAVGVKVYYGYNWDIGPLYIKAYIAFSGELTISWNPAFIRVIIDLVGELAAKIFGFGLSARISADLEIKAPVPWYLYAAAEARFSISLLFFSWSFTAKMDFSWGDNSPPLPPVVLPEFFDEDRRFKALAGSLRNYASLTPDNFTPASNPVVRYLPMDGTIGLEFNRDVDFKLPQSEMDLLDCFAVQNVKDEESPNSSNYQYFHGRVTNLSIKHAANGGGFNSFGKSVYFVWTPTDEADRKRTITRDFDRGYFQFRLNDDPNAHVKLECPDLFQCNTALKFNTENEDLRGNFVYTGALDLQCINPLMKVHLSKDQTGDGPDVYQIDYSTFGARLVTSGPIPFVSSTSGLQSLATEPGMTIELDVPSACISLVYEPKAQLAAGAPQIVSDLITLYDKHDNDITALCDNKIFGHIAPHTLILNDFDPAQNANPRIYKAQTLPIAGVSKIRFKSQGFIWFMKKPGAIFTLFPLAAIDDIYQRNLERVRQMAELEYTFEQTKDPGMILWDPGDYKVKVKTDWWVNRSQAVEEQEITEEYTVIKPFEQKQVKVNEENMDVQPFTPYLRRLTPTNGARPVYGHQLPVVTYTCNYINAMLATGKRRLAILLFDSDNKPCRYTRVIITMDDLSYTMTEDLCDLMRNFGFQEYIDMEAVKEKLPQEVPGVDPSLLEKAMVDALTKDAEQTAVDAGEALEGAPLRLYALPASELLTEARMMRVNRLAKADDEKADRATKLENRLKAQFTEAEDRAVILAYQDTIKVLRIHFVSGIVEYRYTNDDLKLDVSNLQLADCLNGGTQDLNAYERGYFAPIIPKNAFWLGPRANTRYTARIYALDDDEKINNQSPSGPALHSFSFTTSMYEDCEALAKSFVEPKTRQLATSKKVYNKVLKTLTTGLQPGFFAHPADAQWATFDMGLDIFRELAKQPVLHPGDKIIIREMEEKYQELYDKGCKAVTAARKAEGLVFEELFQSMKLKVDPLPTKGVRVTWLKTFEGFSLQFGTLGLLLEFAEPVDWDRTGVEIASFKVRVSDGNADVDVLNLPVGSQYALEMHWVRSFDGTRLLFIPKLTRTRPYQPSIVISDDEPTIMDRIYPIRAETIASLSEIVEAAEGTSAVSTTDLEISNALIRDGNSAENEEADAAAPAVPQASFIGDVAIAAPYSVKDTADIVRIVDTFGALIVENISNYQVSDLQLKLYYLGDNYEKAKKENINFRAIPRLTYWKGAPGDAKGYIGTLKVVSNTAS